MTNTKQIEQAMIVRNNAAALLEDHENEPVDAWELAQETGLTEKQVTQSLKYLAGQGLIELENGRVTKVLPMFTEVQEQRRVPLAERGQLNGDRAWSLLK